MICGCGGGYDFIHGIPLFFALKGMGKNVYFANRTFTAIKNLDGEVISREEVTDEVACILVNSKTAFADATDVRDVYFPEKFLCE